MGIDRRTVANYRTGDASLLYRSHKRSCLHSHKDFILKSLQNGLTQAEIIRQLTKLGYQKTNTNARTYINQLCEEYEINLPKYISLPTILTKETNTIKVDYITRKCIFPFLWMNGKLSIKHHQLLWEKYEVLPELETCIREFRATFSKKVCHYSIFLLKSRNNPL